MKAFLKKAVGVLAAKVIIILFYLVGGPELEAAERKLKEDAEKKEKP